MLDKCVPTRPFAKATPYDIVKPLIFMHVPKRSGTSLIQALVATDLQPFLVSTRRCSETSQPSRALVNGYERQFTWTRTTCLKEQILSRRICHSRPCCGASREGNS